ncbi:MAG TPA: hypothetical protein VLA50_00625 [Erythrobacter sp.]|nr:hypothetical protein [Erythrobacter sp.]
MNRSLFIILGLSAALSACASAPKPSPRPAPQPPRSAIVVVPEVMAPQGLDGVIGLPADRLTRRFGNPRIDLAEGDARKLQFAGQSCVLDVYLYPVSAGAAPTATHVTARLRQGGAAADTGACIREVESR